MGKLYSLGKLVIEGDTNTFVALSRVPKKQSICVAQLDKVILVSNKKVSLTASCDIGSSHV